MKSKKGKKKTIGSGMELVGGGVDLSKIRGGFIGLCACSDVGGVFYGSESGCGCACGCEDASGGVNTHGKTLRCAYPIP